MKNISRIFALLCIAFWAGCASTGPTYHWVKIFEGKMPFEQASAQCDYEAHLQDKADSRADVSGGIGYILMGMPHPTKAMCMRRFGWEAQKIEKQEIQQQTTQQKTKEGNPDEVKNLDVLRDGAEKGDPVAQVNLAYSYLSGYGTNQSNALAYKWYTRAAEKISINKNMAQNAQANLGYMWSNGLGLIKDNIKSMMWLSLASSSGEEEATKRRKGLEQIMLESEIKEAKRLAAICIAKRYKSCDEPVGRAWRTCESTNVLSSNKEVSEKVGSWGLKFVFGKYIDNSNSRIVIFSNDGLKDYVEIELESTSEGMFEDKSKYYSYKAKTGYGRVEESRDNGNLVVSIGKTAEASFDVFAQCK